MNYRQLLRSTASLLAAIAVCSACAVSSFAEESEDSEQELPVYSCGDYTYSRLVNADDETEEAACIQSYEGSDEDLVIPSELDGLEVVMLGDTAFAEAGYLHTVTIPKTVTELGEYTFVGCESLTEYIVEEGNPVFSTIDGVLYTDDEATLLRWPIASCPVDVVIPDHVTRIGNVAFACNRNLKSVTIPDSVTILGISTFSNCYILEKVTLPKDLMDIPGFCFNSCPLLTSIDIPDGVGAIGAAAFAATGLESVTLPSSLVSIGEQAFADTKMTEVTIPATVTEIGYSAFGWKLNEQGELVMDKDFVIHGQEHSAAATYATDEDNENDFKFVAEEMTLPVETQVSETEPATEDSQTEPAEDGGEEQKNNNLSTVGLIGGGVAAVVLAGGITAGLLNKKKKSASEEKGEETDE